MAGPSLSIPLRADMSAFQADMQKASDHVGSAVRSIASKFLDLNKETALAAGGVTALGATWASTGLKIVSTLGVAAIAVTAFSATIGAAVSEAKKQLQDMLDIAEKAAKANVSPEFFQAFTKAGKNAADELETALGHAFEATKEKADQTNATLLKLRDLFLAGVFSQSDNAQGFDIFRNAQTQDDKIRGVVTAMKELEGVGQRLQALDIGERVFGAAFTDKIRRGELSIKSFADQLERTLQGGVAGGDIVSDASVRHAKELNDRLTDAWTTIENNLKPSFAGLAGIALDIKSVWASIVELMAKASALAPSTADKLQDKRNQLAAINTQLEGDIGPSVNGPVTSRRARLENQRNQLATDISRAEFDPTKNLGFADNFPPSATPLPASRPDSAPKAKETVTTTTFSLDQVERLTNALQKSNDVLQAELDNLGKSNVERTKAIDLASAEAAARARGKSLTQEEATDIQNLAEQHARLADALANQRQRLQENADALRFFGQTAADAFADAVIEGKSLNDVLTSVTKSLEKAALSAVFTGQGPLAGILGMAAPASAGPNAVGGLGGLAQSIFGGARAGGGSVDSGKVYLVGENGPEFLLAKGSGMVVPNAVATGSGSGNGPGVSLQIINTTGQPAATERGRGPDGSDMVRIVIGEVKKDMAGGGFNTVMNAKFGIGPVVAQR